MKYKCTWSCKDWWTVGGSYTVTDDKDFIKDNSGTKWLVLLSDSGLQAHVIASKILAHFDLVD